MFTQSLVEFVASARTAELPDAARVEARRAFLNILGCMLGGSRQEAITRMHGAFAPFFGAPTASLIGLKAKADALHACYINCLSSSVDSFDDNHADMIIHPAGPTASVILSLSGLRRIGGKEALNAFALGMEVMCRLCRSISVPPAKSSLAWVQTGIVGGMGAAVTAGTLLGLDAQAMGWALGIANSQAAGFRGNHGTMCTPLMPAQAARTGLESALLAQQGFTSSEISLEAKFGFCNVFSISPNLPVLIEGLGTSFDFLGITYKPFPSGVVLNPIIEASLKAALDENFDAGAIKKVHVRANPTAVTITDRKHPSDPMAAQLSLQHWVAASLSTGRATTAELSAEAVSNPGIVRLRDLVEIEADSHTTQEAASVTVMLENGSSIERRIDQCIGSATRPMSDRELEDKFRNQASTLKSAAEIEQLIELCWRFEEIDDISVISHLAA
jgi:2-methylcitrate dehydratase PrpD